MKISKNIHAAIIGIVLVALAMSATPVLSAYTAQEQLLTHPSFEGGSYLHDGLSNLEAPAGWSIWWVEPEEGCYNFRPNFEWTDDASKVVTGSHAARYYTSMGSHTAGLWQAVSVTAGSTYRFTMSGMAWSTDNPDQAGSTSTTQMKIGIDPQGGTNPFAASIVWSSAVSATDSYYQFTVEATAASDQITVWLYNRPDWCVSWNDAFWDDGSLYEVEGSTAAPATAVPVATTSPDYEVSTPDTSGRIVHTVQPGDTLSGIAWEYGVTTDQIKELNGMTSDIVVLGTQLIISAGASAEPSPAPTEPPATEEPAEVAEVTPEPETEPEEVVPVEPAAPEETAGNGTACVMSYNDGNGNGIREAGEELQAGITFSVSDGASVLGLYTTDGLNEPYCFADLTPGTYAITWTADTFEATTQQTWNVAIESGAILSQDFGVRALGAADAENTAGGGGLPGWLVILLFAVGALVVLGGGGAALYFLVLRRKTI